MKKRSSMLLLMTMAVAFFFTSCKKTDATADGNTNIATQSDDQSRFASGMDDVANDANDIAGSYPEFNGRGSVVSDVVTNIPCNATAVLDSTGSVRRVTVTYNGPNCNQTRSRTGVVVITLPLTQHWGDVGAVLTISSQDLRITRLADNKSITINGTTTVTNVTGGRIINLAAVAPIIHDIASSSMSVTFDNGTHRDWNISKRRTFTYDNGIVITTNGTHTENTVTNISEWGTNRFGNAFTASITSPMIIRQDCSFRLVNGQVTHQGALGSLVATFGLDANGNPTACPGLTAPYYFKAVYTGNNGIVRTIIYPY